MFLQTTTETKFVIGPHARNHVIPSSRGRLSAAFTHSFAMEMVTLDIPEILSPSLIASFTTDSTGKTLLTRPARSASWADIRSPVCVCVCVCECVCLGAKGFLYN